MSNLHHTSKAVLNNLKGFLNSLDTCYLSMELRSELDSAVSDLDVLVGLLEKASAVEKKTYPSPVIAYLMAARADLVIIRNDKPSGKTDHIIDHIDEVIVDKIKLLLLE